MSKKHLKLEPHDAKGLHKGYSVWWYEVNAGININWNNGKTYGNYTIPWESIRAALKRKDKK